MMQVPNEQDELESQIDLREYWKIIRKRMWTVVAFFIITVTVVTIFTLRQKKIYEASASIIIEVDAPQVLGNVREVYNLGPGSYWSNKEYFETQYKVITSRSVAQKVVQLLRLENNKDFLGISHLPEEKQASILQEPIDYVEMVRNALSVEPVKDSRMVRIKARHHDPKWAMRLANATVTAYISHNQHTRRKITEDAAGWLKDQSHALKIKMEKAEDKLHQFKEEQKILRVSLEDRQNITSQRLQDINQTLNKIQAQLDAMEAKRKQVLDIRASKLPLDAIDQVIGNKLIQQLKESYFALKEKQAELASKYLPGHPKYKAIEHKLQVTRNSIDREIDKVLSAMESDYKAKLREEKSAKRRLAQAKAEALEINKKAIQYGRLKREAITAEQLYQLVVKREQETALSSREETNNVYKLDAAILPEIPVYPRVKLNILLAAIVGLLGGIGLAFFLEYLDNTFKGQDDIERVLNIPFLGVIPSIKLDNSMDDSNELSLRDNYLISHPKSTVAESCRTVRTNILFMSPENPARKLLITSPSPQEGKSTVCMNLGITMAQSGSKVVMLDTDMRRPRLHKSFGIKSGLGLTAAILGESELENVIFPSEVPGLDIIPCGPIPPNPTELFHTARFKNIIETLSGKYDRVIFDSPPVLVVADPLILSSMLDGVVLVVKSGSTSSDMARRAVRQLKDVNARILGAVINDLDLTHRDYGYYYYRQYGSYYSEKERDVQGS